VKGRGERRAGGGFGVEYVMRRMWIKKAHAYTHIHTSIHSIHTHNHTHTHTYTHIHTHTYTWTRIDE